VLKLRPVPNSFLNRTDREIGTVKKAKVEEEKYFQFLLAIATKSNKKTAMYLILVSNLFTIAVGSITLAIYPSMNNWGFHIGAGIALTGVAFAIYEVLFINRLFKQAMKTPYEIQISPI
jgi:hypothetical protein